ncbi:MAG: hypothetical protein AB1757_08150 [Acidobacteriota bacterium]
MQEWKRFSGRAVFNKRKRSIVNGKDLTWDWTDKANQANPPNPFNPKLNFTLD